MPRFILEDAFAFFCTIFFSVSSGVRSSLESTNMKVDRAHWGKRERDGCFVRNQMCFLKRLPGRAVTCTVTDATYGTFAFTVWFVILSGLYDQTLKRVREKQTCGGRVRDIYKAETGVTRSSGFYFISLRLLWRLGAKKKRFGGLDWFTIVNSQAQLFLEKMCLNKNISALWRFSRRAASFVNDSYFFFRLRQNLLRPSERRRAKMAQV